MRPGGGYRLMWSTITRIACTVPSALLLRRINGLAGRRRFWKIVKESGVKLARNAPKIGGYNQSGPLGLSLNCELENSSLC